MSNDKFSIGEALGFGWQAFKSRWGFFLGLVAAVALVSFVPDFLTDRAMNTQSGGYISVKLALRLVGLIVGMITTRISLNLLETNGEPLARLGELPGLFVRYFLSKLLYGLISLLAALPAAIAFVFAISVESLAAKIVLGVIAAAGLALALYVSIMFMFVGYLVLDREAGPIEALGESRTITQGSVWWLLLFAVVLGVINLAGLILVGLGLFVTVPVSLMASAHVFRRLSPVQAESAS